MKRYRKALVQSHPRKFRVALANTFKYLQETCRSPTAYIYRPPQAGITTGWVVKVTEHIPFYYLGQAS